MQRLFAFDARQTTLRREALGGVVTFLTMSYIVFVNPAILSSAGLPFDAVAVGTALAAAGFTIIMGLATNLPFALASGLGINAVVAFDIILGRRVSPDVGMACIVLEGAVITDLANRIEDSLIGRNVRIHRLPVRPSAYRFMLGDNSEVGIRW